MRKFPEGLPPGRLYIVESDLGWWIYNGVSAGTLETGQLNITPLGTADPNIPTGLIASIELLDYDASTSTRDFTGPYYGFAAQIKDLQAERDNLKQQLEVMEYKMLAIRLDKELASTILDRELTAALVGKPIVPGTAGQLVKLLREDFSTIEVEGRYEVVDKTGRPLGDVIDKVLAYKEYAHFRLPECIVPEKSLPAKLHSYEPKNLGEAIVHRWMEESKSRPV